MLIKRVILATLIALILSTSAADAQGVEKDNAGKDVIETSVVVMESVNESDMVKTDVEKTTQNEILQIGTISNNLDSSNTGVGGMISPNTPQVLGVSTEYNDYFLISTAAGFAMILLISSFLLIKKRKFLLKGISLRLFDLTVAVISLSVFGLGVCGGYYLCKTFFPEGILSQQVSVGGSGDNSAIKDNSSNDDYDIEFNYENLSLPAYSKPDDNSEVKFELTENTKLKKIDEAAGWYRILLENGTHGWVKIKDIQSINAE